MIKEEFSKLIILGSGPAGYTAAIYASRSNLDPLLITGINLGGQLYNTSEIENWPGDFNKLTGPQLMERMYRHIKKFNVNIIFDNILKVNFKEYPFYLYGEKKNYSCKSLIIATGSSVKYLGISSEEKYKGKGVSTCAICDGFFYKNKIVAVVGGGNTAAEEVLYLSKIANKVILIHRNEYFKAEKILIDKIMYKIKNENILLYINNIVLKINGDNNKVTSLLIKNIKNNLIQNIKIDAIFIAIGQNPNTNIFIDQLKLNNRYIVTNKYNNIYSTATSIPGIFAAGDVTYGSYKQAITAAGEGCMAAIDAYRYLENKK